MRFSRRREVSNKTSLRAAYHIPYVVRAVAAREFAVFAPSILDTKASLAMLAIGTSLADSRVVLGTLAAVNDGVVAIGARFPAID